MVIGSHVTTVQRVSGYCLKQDLEVFPYYGIPTDEDLALFAPHVLVLCVPMLEDFQSLLSLYSHILWSEQPSHEHLSFISNPRELSVCLQKTLLNLDQPIPDC